MPVDGLRGKQHVGATAEESAACLAEVLAQHLRQRLAVVAQVHLALSGGSSGKVFCAALAQMRGFDWARTHVWMVDERCVADDDPRLNFGTIRDELAALVPAANLHPMPVARLDGALVYEHELRAALAERQASDQRLDAVVLGMGADGHTASLFPGTLALDERERWIVLNDGPTVAPPRPRMTMTFPLLNRARFVALLVTGASKQAALARVVQATEDYHALPVAGLAPAADARLLWCLDQAALPV